MGIHILQWNANSLVAHIHELKHFLDSLEHLPEIICVQETLLKPNLHVNIPGYSCLRLDGTNGGRGVAIFVKCGLSCLDIVYYEGIEGSSVKINNSTSV